MENVNRKGNADEEREKKEEKNGITGIKRVYF